MPITVNSWFLVMLGTKLPYPAPVDIFIFFAWWRHQLEAFSALLALCAGHSPITGEFIAQSQWRGTLISFYLRLNKRLRKQSWGWWFETPSRSLFVNMWPKCKGLNSFTPEKCGNNFRTILYKLILRIDILSTTCEIGHIGEWHRS